MNIDNVEILLVDDDRRNLLAIEAMLGGLGLEIVCASSVREALRSLLLHDFALILLDIKMPEMDGVELAEIIRSRERTRRVPIMFLTAYDQGEAYVARGYSVGAVDFLFKPPVPEVLRSKVLSLVDLHRKTKEVELQAELLRAAERDAHERRLAEFRATMEAASLRSAMASSQRMNERLQILTDVATELLGRADPIEVLDSLAPRLLVHLGYEVCVGYQIQPSGNLALVTAAGTDDIGWDHRTIFADDGTSVMQSLLEGTRYVSEDMGADDLPRWLVDLKMSACAVLPIQAGGKPVGLVACGKRSAGALAPEDVAAIQVVCDQIALATERDRLMRALHEQAEALSDAHRRKDEFLAMLAHELRNPLAPMRYALDMLQQRDANDDDLALHGVLQRQLTHLSRMVDDLLDVSRITSGKIDLELGSVSVNAMLLHAVETSRPQIDKHGHTFEVQLAEPDRQMRGDSTRLTQIVANLLNNAARYTDPGGRIVLAATCDASRVTIKVSDNGRGMTAEMLPKVFDLFVQAERTRDRAQGGLGLGLTLVRRLVEMHGGTVFATSDGPGRGSEFSVFLPIDGDATEAPAPAPPAVTTGRHPTARRGGGLSILVVEDNEDSRDMLQLLLEARGHRVDVAADGTAGLAELLTARHDVALLDIGLPGVDGYEVARRVREQQPERTTRLIAITGYGQGEDRARALEAGFDEHLVKPVSVRDLERVLPRE